MKYSFFAKNWHYFVLNFLLLFIFACCYGRFGNIIVDSFREAYIPAEILKGKLLYKDIFTIYAPFSYLFNAILFYIFGVKLKVLYFAGFLTTAGILNLTFLISKKFVPKIYALGIILFIISVSVLSPNVFNYIFPYSYGILYGILFALGSLYLAINKHYTGAYLLYSFAICSKYEFIFLFFPLLYLSGLKYFWKYILAIVFPIIICIIPLVMQGIRMEDLSYPISLLVLMGGSKTLHWFYSVSGLIFRPELLIVYLQEFIKIFIPIFVFVKLKKWYVGVLSGIFICFVLSPKIFIYVLPLILILFICKYKKLNKKQKFVIVSSILISLKVFFALTFESYGVFFIPFILISIFILISKKYKKILLIVIIFSSLFFGVKNIIKIFNKNIKIETERGVIYTDLYYGSTIEEINEFLKTTNKNDRVIIYPECLAPLFLVNRETDSKMYSLIPMYVETFGEDLVISRIGYLKPEYIIITNYDTSNYYYKQFGNDYAQGIKEFITMNYSVSKIIDNNFSAIIYKRK